MTDSFVPSFSDTSKEDDHCLTCVVEIINHKGLHARAAAKFVKIVSEYDADVWVLHGIRKVPGNSLMGLLLLAAGKGTKLTLKAQGLQHTQVLEALKSLVENLFHENA